MKRRIVAMSVLMALFSLGLLNGQTGRQANDPLYFSDIAPWIADARPSMELFESVLKRDFFALRLAMEMPLVPIYFAMEDGSVSRSQALHASFQGMFWGPLFAFTIWTPTFLLFDWLLGGEGDVAAIPMTILKSNLETLEGQSEGAIPFSKILRFNVLFVSDLVHLDFRQVGSDFYTLGGISRMGRSYAGICLKVLDDYNLFLGFNLLSFPLLDGWQEYQDANPDFASQAAVAVQNDAGTTLYQMRSRFFVYTDIFDSFKIKGLLDFSSMEGLLDLLGLGASLRGMAEGLGYADLARKIRVFLPDMDLSYLGQLKSTRFTLYRDFAEEENVDLYYRWDLSLIPLNILQSLRAGLMGRWGILMGRVEGLVAREMDEFVFGGFAELRIKIPKIGSLRAAFSWNDTGTGGGIPFYRDVPLISLELQSGMTDDSNPFAGVVK